MYSEGVAEEATFLLLEWLASPPVHGTISFPEIIVPVVVLLRKSVKSAKTGTSKEQSMVKALLERMDESARWVEERRKDVSFAPGKLGDVAEWERSLKSKLGDAPLSKYLKVQRKTREKRRKLVDKVFAFYGFFLFVLTVNHFFSRLGKAKMRFWKSDLIERLILSISSQLICNVVSSGYCY